MERNYFKVKASVIGILPQNVREMTQLYCPRCVQTYSFRDIESDCSIPLQNQIYVCPTCQEVGDPESLPPGTNPRDLIPYPIYQVCFIVKDDSTAAFDRCFKLYYYSNEQHRPGEELFGGLRAVNLYRDDSTRDIILKYI